MPRNILPSLCICIPRMDTLTLKGLVESKISNQAQQMFIFVEDLGYQLRGTVNHTLRRLENMDAMSSQKSNMLYVDRRVVGCIAIILNLLKTIIGSIAII